MVIAAQRRINLSRSIIANRFCPMSNECAFLNFDRLRKSSSPSHWLMGLPPTSPRLKFVHTHPGGSPVPRRPPRHPPSPSARSRSLELLDQDEKKSVLPIAEPEPLPRPRSKSLDGLLDEDGITAEMKTEETSKRAESNGDVERPERRTSTGPTAPMSEASRNEEIEKGSNGMSNPMPVPRLKGNKPSPSVAVDPRTEQEQEEEEEERKEEPTRTVPGESAGACCSSSSSSEENTSEKEEPRPARPPKPCRSVGVDGESSAGRKTGGAEERPAGERSEIVVVQPCDSKVESERRRTDRLTAGNEKSTLLKAKSCGAGLDSDESTSSSGEYKPNVKGQQQGSLLSLPTGAEPKRKKNFMDKCVNKVRSFMRK